MKTNNKVDAVYHVIKKDIERGMYLPGDRLVISRLAKRNGCSEIPVREALRRLESEHFVELIPNRGAVVSCLTMDYMNQLFAVKTELESFAVRESIGKLSKRDIAELRKMISEMYDCFEKGNLKQCSVLNHRFHMKIYRAAGNDVLADYIEEMWNKWPIGHYTDYVPGEWYTISNEQHERLLDAIIEENAKEAEAIIRKHKKGAISNFGKGQEMHP